MIRLKGTGCAKGEAYGRIEFYRRAEVVVVKKSLRSADEEELRFRCSQKRSEEELLYLCRKCRDEMGEDAALLFETHAMLASDADFSERVCELINSEKCTAEYAVREAGEEFAKMMEQTDDDYMRARAADIRDVARRILNHLTGARFDDSSRKEHIILAADDLAPSETVQLDRSKILGFVLREGSVNGHTAILAKTMGIPAICLVGDALREDCSGMMAFIDGSSGEIDIDPDEKTEAIWKKRMESRAERINLMQSMRGKDDVTPNGIRIPIYCNISSADDIGSVLENDGRGVGLFRSEFLYLASHDYPSEETQFRAYKKVVESMGTKRVVIRTLDIGADKQADYIGMKKEENPAMGMRAVRFCLERPDIFRVQLRAIYRASAYGKAAILFPMITSVWEVEECMRICREVMGELRSENIPFDPLAEIGIMIETPASVLIADELAELVDFFSIGTNDLTQYTLACDRQNGGMERFCDTHHPAVIRSIKEAAEAAHRHGIWVGVCGELAADEDMLGAFISLGIDELSVPPSCVLPLRAAIRSFRNENKANIR